MKNKMYKVYLSFILCIMLFMNGLCHAASSVDENITSIQWQNGTIMPFKQAKISHHLILVYVKADWCHWCQLMRDTTLPNKELIKIINTDYLPVKLDIDKDTAIARQYNVTSLPTIIILDGNKKIIQRFSGYISPEDMIKKLR